MKLSATWSLWLPVLVVTQHASSVDAFAQVRAGHKSRPKVSTLALQPTTRCRPLALASIAAPSDIRTFMDEDSKDDAYTIQILMSDTGGGHRASANAIQDALNTLYPDQFQCDIVDIYTEYGPFFPYTAYVPAYKIMAKYSFLWDWFFQFGETEFGLQLNEFLLETFCFDAFTECLDRPQSSTGRRADLVVSVHPLCQDIPLKILASLDSDGQTRDPANRTTPFVTVVTDLGGGHKTWFNSDVDKCFVPSDVLNEKAQSRQLAPEQIVQYGLPIREGFWSSTATSSSEPLYRVGETEDLPFFRSLFSKRKTIMDKSTSTTFTEVSEKEQMRIKLGLDDALPTVLVVGGGDGMGGIVKIANALGQKLGEEDAVPSQMVVVCGNNANAKQTLDGMQWGSNVRVDVRGFVNNMDEWMKASDALVTKAGPGTIAEASICGLPCMLFAYLPGQEEGNVPFVEDAGFGKYSESPAVIADTVTTWLSDPVKLESMRGKALEAARPSATLDIAKDLAQIVFATKKELVKAKYS